MNDEIGAALEAIWDEAYRHGSDGGSDYHEKDAVFSNARAAIEAHEARKVPDGWQLVPKEPTVSMAQALLDYPESDEELPWPKSISPNFALAAYRIMLASAPPAPPAPQANPSIDRRIAAIAADRDYWRNCLLELEAKQASSTAPVREPLTPEHIREAVRSVGMMFTAPDIEVARAIEAAHGITKDTQ